MSFGYLQAAYDFHCPTGAQKIVLVTLAFHANDAGSCFPSISTLARECCIDRATVIRHLAALETRGLISTKRAHRRSNTYQIEFPPRIRAKHSGTMQLGSRTMRPGSGTLQRNSGTMRPQLKVTDTEPTEKGAPVFASSLRAQIKRLKEQLDAIDKREGSWTHSIYVSPEDGLGYKGPRMRTSAARQERDPIIEKIDLLTAQLEHAI